MSYKSYNLYKANWVTVDSEDVCVIDNNALSDEKIKKQRSIARPSVGSAKPYPYQEGEEGFAEGLAAENVDALFAEREGGTVLKGPTEEEKEALQQEIDALREELGSLHVQADRMLEDARIQIEVMKKEAFEDAKQQGYQEGERLGKREAEQVRREYQQKQKELEADYANKIESLEPDFVECLTGIYEHIFRVDLSRYRGLVESLLLNAMQKAEDTRHFLVHVSKEDYEGVLADKEKLRAEAGSGNAAVELVEDMTLSRSKCYIETENGIYDCSLDTQLSELSRKLKLLSYQKD